MGIDSPSTMWVLRLGGKQLDSFSPYQFQDLPLGEKLDLEGSREEEAEERSF